MNHTSETVSVLMLAYRHGPYIRQAIESVLAQQCDRSFRLWIGEDNSPDDTRAVCRELQVAHPDRIELFCSDDSLGMHGNFSNLWEKSRGDLVAFCEGDDYWCDPLKLQKQIDFFEEHPECSLCGTFTDVHCLEDGAWKKSGEVRPPTLQSTYSFEEMIPSYMFHFSSVMLRRSAVDFPDWFQSTYCVDRPIYLLAAQNGQAGLLAETTSVYRMHPGGNWSTLNATARMEKSIHLFETMSDFFAPEYAATFRRTVGDILWSYIGQAAGQRDIASAATVYRRCVRYLPTSHFIRYIRNHIGLWGRFVLWRVGRYETRDGGVKESGV